ncbi:histidine kinase [Muricauda sp. HICW]|uniref:Histidine kinase n=1 Tax=Flagellimonas chongwuensis TaxID=2697365 RepID=A0A850NI36_9FLAO|nr:2TM domain-containing protein [Allomuricauda chongwuensis]NVN18630.1 histidine kinase [Allomuricauda chongwuensis]
MKNVNEHRYTRAKERVENLKSFYQSLIAYCVVIPVLIYINHRTTDIPWAIFPAVGWGFGLFSLWMTAYGHNPIFGKDWEERKIQEFMNDKEF